MLKLSTTIKEQGMKQVFISVSVIGFLLLTSGCILTTTSTTVAASSGSTTVVEDPGMSAYREREMIKQRVIKYVKQNSENVKKEIAAGSGEHLDALVQILSVTNPDAFKGLLQENFDTIYPNETDTNLSVANRIFNMAY